MARGTFSDDGCLSVPYSTSLRQALLRLDELVDWERLRRSVRGEQRLMRVSCQPAKRLLAALGNPQHAFGNRVIHVTGSKGKGTVCALIAYGLQQLNSNDQPVAIYTSPHVERINERVRFNNSNVTDDVLASSLAQALDAREELLKSDGHDHTDGEITWFDTMAAAGILAAKERNASHLVVEVGLGGRHDSTNVFNGAPVSVITNIHLEHADIIGPTLRDIAYEKAGVIGRNTRTAIIGLPPPPSKPSWTGSNLSLSSIFRDEAAKYKDPQTQCLFVPPAAGDSLFATNVKLSRTALEAVLKLEGSWQSSSGTSVPTVEQLLSDDDAKRVISSCLPARQEVFQTPAGVRVLLDGAHVPQSVTHVLEEVALQNKHAGTWGQAERQRDGKKPKTELVVVVAMGKDKDVDGIIRAIIDAQPAYIVATKVGDAVPYLSADDLGTQLQHRANTTIDMTIMPPFKVIQSPLDAVVHAIERVGELSAGSVRSRNSTEDSIDNVNKPVSVVVVGSLHLAGRVRPVLRRLQAEAQGMGGNVATEM